MIAGSNSIQFFPWRTRDLLTTNHTWPARIGDQRIIGWFVVTVQTGFTTCPFCWFSSRFFHMFLVMIPLTRWWLLLWLLFTCHTLIWKRKRKVRMWEEKRIDWVPEDLLTLAADDIPVEAVDVDPPPDDEETVIEDRLQLPWQLQWQVIWCSECSAQITSFLITNSLNFFTDPDSESRSDQYICMEREIKR